MLSLAAALTGAGMGTSTASAATNPTTVTADIIRVAFGLSIETEPSITLNIKPTPEGAMTVVGSTVTTGTSSPSGYTLYLQMTGENSTTSSLINNIDTNAALTSSGSFDSPTTLSSGTWGYAIPHEASSVLSTNRFDDSYTEVESVAQTGSKFAAVPASNTSAEKIAATSGPSVVELPVYYGVMASYNTLSGSYSNKVLYTALADDTPIHTASVSPTSIFDEGAETLNVFTPLHTTNPDVVAEAYLLTPEQYAAVTRTENPVPISTYSANKMACTRTAADSVTLSCTTIPATVGNAYVYVDIPGYNDHYDASITIKPKNLTITVQNTNTTSGAPSVTVPYGSSATVTVTPNAGYYLGGVTCPAGFTCSGYTTGTSATTQQTVTITHDDALTGGTIGFTGTIALPLMQDQANIDACKNAATGTTFTLADSRDNNEYKVRKLADGKCWMVQNLRLAGPKTLTAADSNVNSDFNLLAPTSSDTYWCTTDNSACNDQSMSIDSGSTDYGFYYNWYTATAGNGKYSTSSGTVSYDICPKGWKLPSTNGYSTDFQRLYNNYKSASKMRAADGPAFVLSGYRRGSGTYDQGSYGHYWSSTAGSSDYAYTLGLDNSAVYPAVDNNKHYGFSVRCVAK